jgi:hypothetical protein
MTMPKSKNATEDGSETFVRLVRRSVAQSYALGGNMMVPWDIYLPTPAALRYYGDPSQYADLFEFIREQADMLEELGPDAPFDRNSTDGFHVLGTGAAGAGGDGVRFRFPTDTPPSRGVVLEGTRSQGACAWECRRRSAGCAGFFSSVPRGGRGSCVLLSAPLETIHGTAVSGWSWKTTTTNTTTHRTRELDAWRGARSNVTFVDVVLRGRAESTINRRAATAAAASWAVHLVNWAEHDEGHGVVGLQLENGVMCGAEGAASSGNTDSRAPRVLTAVLRVPGGGATPRVLWRGPPESGYSTSVALPLSLLQPWGVVRVTCEEA